MKSRRSTGKIMIIDGYNVIHSLPFLQKRLDQSLRAARTGLIRCCLDWLQRRKDVEMFYVVFDGSSEVLDWSEGSERVRVVYSDGGETADERIARIVRLREKEDNCVVVSDDNHVRASCRSRSCDIMSVEGFCATLNRKKQGPRATREQHGTKTGLLPEQERRITDELRGVWHE